MPLVLASLLVAFVFDAVALPDVLIDWRPAWVLIVSLYWVIHVTHRFGIVACWIVGLLTDVLTAAPLGLHALGFAIAGGIAWRFSVLVRVFGLAQQGLIVVALVLLVVILGYVLQWLTGMPVPGFWPGPVLSSALVWLPVAFTLRWLQHFFEPH